MEGVRTSREMRYWVEVARIVVDFLSMVVDAVIMVVVVEVVVVAVVVFVLLVVENEEVLVLFW